MPKPILIGSAACAEGAAAARAKAASEADSHPNVLRRVMVFLLSARCLILARIGTSFLRSLRERQVDSLRRSCREH
jgi:hypothetical protein